MAYILQTDHGIQPLHEPEWFETACEKAQSYGRSPEACALDLRTSNARWAQVPTAEDFLHILRRGPYGGRRYADKNEDGRLVNLTRYKFNAHYSILRRLRSRLWHRGRVHGVDRRRDQEEVLEWLDLQFSCLQLCCFDGVSASKRAGHSMSAKLFPFPTAYHWRCINGY